jgi:predicted DNA-binding protein
MPKKTPTSEPNRYSPAGKAYSSRGELRRQYMARLPESTYEALMQASEATGVSANALVSEAIDSYLASDRFRDRLVEARAAHHEKSSRASEAARRQQEAIAKLSGSLKPTRDGNVTAASPRGQMKGNKDD